jgi:hypothetical protein
MSFPFTVRVGDTEVMVAKSYQVHLLEVQVQGLIDANQALLRRAERAEFLHDLDHKLADQWYKRAAEAEALLKRWHRFLRA